MIKINDNIIERKYFRDNTLNLSIPRINSFGEVKFTWLFEDDAELFMLQCLADKFVKSEKKLVLPYIPNARMDRVKNPEDVFTLKSFCKAINRMNFNRVIVFDPHSDVSTALLDNVMVMPWENFQIAALEDPWIPNDYVYFYPDAGAAKRYSNNVAHTFGVKKRNWETHQIESFTLANPEVVKDKNVIIVDDICSFGGTAVKSANALKEAGAKNIYLIISHCEKSIFLGDVFKCGNIDKVITSNSLLSENDIPVEFKDKIKIINMF